MNDFSKESFEKFKEFIYRKSGIFLEYDKHYDKLNKFLQKSGFDSFRKYFFDLRFEDKDGEKFQDIINSITVNETYFFREKHQFEILIAHILPEIDALKPKDEPIRILSAPCSTGEEPYSIAIYLLEDNNIVNRRDFEIFGIDIDTEVVKKAKAGLFSERSLHAISNNLKEKYFQKKMSFFEINSDLKDVITFKKANVFNKIDMRALGKFDIIFSRNMLIYFDDASRKEVAMTFYDMLNSGGYILLGHAEYMNRIVSVFEPKKIEHHLIYKK